MGFSFHSAIETSFVSWMARGFRGIFASHLHVVPRHAVKSGNVVDDREENFLILRSALLTIRAFDE